MKTVRDMYGLLEFFCYIKNLVPSMLHSEVCFDEKLTNLDFTCSKCVLGLGLEETKVIK